MAAPPQSARRHYLWSSLLVTRAVREAESVRKSGVRAVAKVITTHQMVAAREAQPAVARMLAEQNIDQAAQAFLDSTAFTTSVDNMTAMLDQTATDSEFDRIVASLVADAGRAADQVATSVVPKVGYVRFLSPPSCSRCAVLAGRVYRYSEGFLRHPACDCTMIPTSLANPAFHHDPVDLMREGQVTGLSKADQRAVADGADFNKVVNVRLKSAGLRTPGRVLIRAGRPTPEGIYATASSRDDAIQRLIAAGYVR